MEINELSIKNGAEWQAIVTRDRNADFLLSYEWARMLELSYGFEPHFIEFREEGEPVGCALAFGSFNVSRGGNVKSQVSNKLNSAFSRSFICHNGPAIFDPSKTEAVTNALLLWLDGAAGKQQIKGVKFTLFRYNWNDVDPASTIKMFESSGFKHRRWATYLVDLNQSEEELWNYIGKSARKSLKKVRESDVQVKRVRDHDEFLEKFIEPYNRMEREHGRSQIPLEHVEKTRELDYLNRYYHYYYAESEGTILGAIGMCTFNGWAAELMSSTSRYAQENRIYVQDLLHWQMFLDARELGCHTFDLAGVNPEPKDKKEEGINQFKKKWGGRYVEYPIFEKQSRSMASRLRSISDAMKSGTKGDE